MKDRVWFLPLAVVLIFGPLCVGRQQGEKQSRTVIHLLDVISAGVGNKLEAGEPLPTNWMTLSNSVNWDLLLDICKSHNLPHVTNLFTILPDPPLIVVSNAYVTNMLVYGGPIFLIATRPTGSLLGGYSRWALVKISNPGSPQSPGTQRVARRRVPGYDLPQVLQDSLEPAKPR
jgi:hypothetical protein